jgi:hypothetical protein
MSVRIKHSLVRVRGISKMKELVKAVLAIVLFSSQLLLYIGVTWRVIGGENFDRHKEWAALVDLLNVTAHTGHPLQLGLLVAVPLVYVSLGVSLVYSLLYWLTQVYNWLLGCWVRRRLASHRLTTRDSKDGKSD